MINHNKLARLLSSQNVRDGFIVFVATMTVNVFNYLYHMICSRVLGLSGYGTLATLVAGYSLLNAIPIILLTVTVKFAAELHAVDDTARLRALTQAMTRVCALLAVLVLGIFALCSSALSRFLHVDFWALALTVIAIAFAIIVPATRGVLQGVQDYRSFAVATMVECFVRLGCGVGFAAHGFGAAGAMAGFAIGSAASWLYASLTIRKHITTNDNTMNLTIDFKRLAMTSRGVTLSTIALTILGFVDVVFVKHYLTAREAGLYGVLSLAGKIIIFSVSFIPTLLLPKAVQAITRGGDARGILIKAILATTGLSAVSLAVFFALPSLIVRVMAGSDFLAAAPYIFSYGVATSLLAATTLAATYNIGIHRFAFIPRLLAVCALEVAGICWQHHSMAEIVRIVVFANAAGLLAAIVPPARKPSQNG